ncbi:MAG: FAD-binding protein [Synergistaceae bacterium]|nr:FAD-binding protein [Synergistaceae bacterium]
MKKVLVVGGGLAGCVAAIRMAEGGARILIAEREPVIVRRGTRHVRRTPLRNGHIQRGGDQRKAFVIARNMMADGEPIEKITGYTGLTREEVEMPREY